MENPYIGYDGQDGLPPVPAPIDRMAKNVLIGQLLKGHVPWQNPWQSEQNHGNAMPGYIPHHSRVRGINTLLLWAASREKGFVSTAWGTAQNWQTQGDSIRNGESPTDVIYFDTAFVETDGQAIQRDNVMLKQVYCLDQALPNPARAEAMTIYDRTPPETVGLMEEFLYNVDFAYDRTDHGIGYNYFTDRITLSEKNGFIDTGSCKAIEAYYCKVIYNLMLWTGGANRLDRETAKRHSSSDLGAEKLIAEIGTGLTCAEFNIAMPDRSHDIAGLIDLLHRNGNDIVFLANEASKASECLFYLQPHAR